MLIVGGAGAFGARLVEGVVATTDLTVIVAGRDLVRTASFAGSYPEGRVRAVRLDADAVSGDDLRALGIGLAVDAAGPFQDREPRLAQAAIAAGLPYLDLADGRGFVAAFAPKLDEAARAAGVAVLTGASSTPALSNAVLDAITSGWQSVEAISVAIAPGNRAPRGLSVMRAILSYAGRPVRVFRGGRWESRPGWGLLAREDMPRLGRRWLSLCETPDLDILPARFPAATTAIFRAGLELPILHLGLWLASLPVRWRVLPSLTPLAKPFLMMAGWFDRFGNDRGGMTVEALGRDAQGRPARALWSLVAEAGDGPVVPTLPALAAIRLLTDPEAEAVAPGARPCIGILPLPALEAEIGRHRIRTHLDLSHPQPLFARALGSGYAVLPEPIRALHGTVGGATFSGHARVDRGRSPFASFVCAAFRLPRPIADCRVRVAIVPEHRRGTVRERWVRAFEEQRFASMMSLAPQGVGRGLMRERFGPFTMDLAVTAGAEGIDMIVTGWRLGTVPLPRALRPTTRARERIDDSGRFRFDVSLFLPLIGLLVRYRGWLVPDAPNRAEGHAR